MDHKWKQSDLALALSHSSLSFKLRMKMRHYTCSLQVKNEKKEIIMQTVEKYIFN